MVAERDNIGELQARLDRETAERGPVIEVRAGELSRLIETAQRALLETGGGIYQRGGQLVRVVRLAADTLEHGITRTAGTVIIAPVAADYLTVALARAAQWTRYDGRTRSQRLIDPPAALARSILAVSGEWPFPQLRGITAAPTLRRDGSLLDQPGYDEASGLYGAFADGEFPSIPPKPSRDDALTALDQLDDLYSEFDFAGGGRSAHASVAIGTAGFAAALAAGAAEGRRGGKQSGALKNLATLHGFTPSGDFACPNLLDQCLYSTEQPKFLAVPGMEPVRRPDAVQAPAHGLPSRRICVSARETRSVGRHRTHAGFGVTSLGFKGCGSGCGLDSRSTAVHAERGARAATTRYRLGRRVCG